ncbi:toll/interleukin-1 receptor domain-containing protein [Streptomyces sp. R28]|uniref:Toll/interleukin-1 receptor domain-containing protein n=1 Tax=Streptomyces sp. R28 TaxID=3238628 RepID=A0AB39PTY6_9ACTN
MWDVFLSYSRGDVERVRPLARALRDGGLDVFTDETGVESFAGISATIRRELGRSKALLAFYSTGYPEREACQWELTTAYLAGLGEGDRGAGSWWSTRSGRRTTSSPWNCVTPDTPRPTTSPPSWPTYART